MSALLTLLRNFKSTDVDCNQSAPTRPVRRANGAKHFAAWLVAASALLGAPAALAQQAPPTEATMLIVGDSLSAQYGLKLGTGWVPLLEKQLAQEKKSLKIINASISGDTTSGGRSRLPALLTQHRPKVVVIELGSNDALRGLPLPMTEKNLSAMTQAAKKSGAKVLLLGMQIPPNYGNAYSAEFAGLFAKVAKAEKVALLPFFLQGIADGNNASANFQADGIHPNEAAQAKMLANVWPELKKIIP